MAPINALGNPTAAKLRAAAEGDRRASKSPPTRRRKSAGTGGGDSVRIASADGFEGALFNLRFNLTLYNSTLQK